MMRLMRLPAFRRSAGREDLRSKASKESGEVGKRKWKAKEEEEEELEAACEG